MTATKVWELKKPTPRKEQFYALAGRRIRVRKNEGKKHTSTG